MIKIGGITSINLHGSANRDRKTRGTDEATYHIGTEAWFILPLQQLAPVDVGEEMVRLDLCGAVGTQTSLGIAFKQSRKEITSSRRNHLRTRERQRLLQNLSVHDVGVFIIEWW